MARLSVREKLDRARAKENGEEEPIGDADATATDADAEHLELAAAAEAENELTAEEAALDAVRLAPASAHVTRSRPPLQRLSDRVLRWNRGQAQQNDGAHTPG